MNILLPCVKNVDYMRKSNEKMNYTKIISDMQQLHTKECTYERDLPAYATFPYNEAYVGQNEAIKIIMQEDRCLLCSHTGSGKSTVFLTAAHELDIPTLVIEPRKFLQVQLAAYFNDFVLFGKSEYKCFYADSAAHAPCAKTYTRDKQKYFSVRNQYTGVIEEKPYPCEGCEYYYARIEARKQLSEKGVLIVNMGNFWMWRDATKFIVVDEADEFFRSISSGIGLYEVSTKDIDEESSENIVNIIKKEEEGTENKIEFIKTKEVVDVQDAKKLNAFNNHLEKLRFFQRNIGEAFYYTKKSTKQVYVELQPDKISALVERLFSGKKLCLVSATPSAFVQKEKK